MGSQLLDLPNEVLSIIFGCLGSEDLASLQTCCGVLRNLLVAQLWRHVHLDIQAVPPPHKQSNGTDMDKDPDDAIHGGRAHFAPYVSTQCYCGLQFVNNHRCEKSVMHLDTLAIRDLCETILKNRAQMLSHVRVLSLSVNCYLPPSTLQPRSMDELDDLQEQAVINWFLDQVPQLMDNLKMLEIHTQLNEPTPNPIVQRLISSISTRGVQISLDYELARYWQDLGDKLAIEHPDRKLSSDTTTLQNLKILNLVLKYFDHDLHNTGLIFGWQLPSLVEKVSISERVLDSVPLPSTAAAAGEDQFMGIQAEVLAQFMRPATRLRCLSVFARVDNRRSITWIPPSVTELAMDDSTISYETEFAVPNVESFHAMTSAVGSECVLNYFAFKNLKRLFVNFYLGGSHELLHAGAAGDDGGGDDRAAARRQQVGAAVRRPMNDNHHRRAQQEDGGGDDDDDDDDEGSASTKMQQMLKTIARNSPELTHIRTWGLPYRLVRHLAGPNVRSLVVHNGAVERSPDDIISVARACPKLDIGALDLSSVVAFRQYIDCIAGILAACNGLRHLYVQTTDTYLARYKPVPHGYLFDGHSTVMFPSVRELDIQHFVRQYQVD